MTELKPCPFCGGEAHTYKNNLWHVACERAHNGCVTMSAFITEAEAIAAWNNRTSEQAIAATLGSGKLTAEQVRDTVEKHWHDLPADYDMPEATALPEYSYDWRAIADELNATLGSGECEIVEHYAARTRGEIGRERVKLSCGHIVERHSKFCQECGLKIRGAVKR